MRDAKKTLQRALEHVQDALDGGEFEFDPETVTALHDARDAIRRAADAVRSLRSLVEPAHEVAAQRIEARVMEGRPTPPGVFPPMTGFCAVACTCGWQGVGESRLLAHVREAHGLEAASLREVERIAPPPAEVDFGQPSPAEAAIFERGGYVPRDCVTHASTVAPRGPVSMDEYRQWKAHVADVTPGPATGCGAMLEERHPAASAAQYTCPPTPLRYLGCPVHAPIGGAPTNATYEQADAEYVSQQVAKWGADGESLVAVWGRVELFARTGLAASASGTPVTPRRDAGGGR